MMICILILVLVCALILTAFCAGAETGFLSVSRGRIVHLAREGSRAAQRVEVALRQMARTTTELLVGSNLGTVIFSSASSALAAELLIQSSMARVVWGFFSATVILVLGEFLPKLFCSARPLRRILRLAWIHAYLAKVLSPLTRLAEFLTNFVMPKSIPRETLSPDALLRILSDRKSGVKLTDFESALITRILVLRKKHEPVTAEAILSAIDETN